ncbi:MAG: hypothetical protein KF716_12820 [Anaerolineae bacterium]|nr:hypothetical protein [Anaerolineae bacterium]
MIHTLQQRLGLSALCCLLVLTACSTPPPTPTPRPTLTATAIPTSINRELPPTWTPTFTFTPRPTRTPLPTPTIVPTFTSAELCQFFAIVTPASGVTADFNAVVTFSWKGVPKGRTMQLSLLRQNAQGGIKLDVPFDGGAVFPISLKLLPGSGTYEWRAVVIDPLYGEICETKGILVRARPDWF